MNRKVKEMDSLFDIESCQILILVWKYAHIYIKGSDKFSPIFIFNNYIFNIPS